ncbi:hypothetical protein AB7038_09965 [Morganella morganii]|uniref:hypothetical protein n=1 Tax=Morganella morganii TaxID=582 RepID=UPI0034E4765B
MTNKVRQTENGKNVAGKENLNKMPALTIKPPPLTPRPTTTVTPPPITTPNITTPGLK